MFEDLPASKDLASGETSERARRAVLVVSCTNEVSKTVEFSHILMEV